jgi:prolipoprotein diacylglyceryltransferase
VPLHPTQLFESAIEVANFFILVRLLDRKRFDGQVMAVYLAVYAHLKRKAAKPGLQVIEAVAA